MISDAVISRVIAFITDAHMNRALRPENRFRKGTGLPYSTHPIAVAKIAPTLFPFPLDIHSKQTIEIISYLHDLLEDTDVTRDELIEFLKQIGLHEIDVVIIVSGVVSLTKPKDNFEIIPYLTKIRSHNFARVVKLADLQHNMSDLKPGNLLDKYKLCKYFLEQ